MPSDTIGHLSQYSLIERLLHRIAFMHPKLQRILSEVEDNLFESRVRNEPLKKPVFITGLPRAGTTLLLELLYKTGEFSTYTYRQMPFLLTPLLWNSLSNKFQQPAIANERAHGDGMEISFDSPEAFEEVIWLNFFKSKIVNDNSIRLLSITDVTNEFVQFFVKTANKLLSVSANNSGNPRYLSKNNANIARLEILSEMFPDAVVLVCFRDPLTHIVSLQNQHERFLKIHAEDKFAKKYMEWIGHYDFGANFRPINFSNNDHLSELVRPYDAEFWLQYWIDAYSQVLECSSDTVRFVSMEYLLTDSVATLSRLASILEIEDPQTLVAGAKSLREPGSQKADASAWPKSLIAKATLLYQSMQKRSV